MAEVMRLVLGSNYPRAVGERIVVDVFDAAGAKHHQQPLYVLREVNEQDWRSSLAQHGNLTPRRPMRDEAYYYEVATD